MPGNSRSVTATTTLLREVRSEVLAPSLVSNLLAVLLQEVLPGTPVHPEA